MKLPQNYLDLISQQNTPPEAMEMTALALMSFGGKPLGGNTFNALRAYAEGHGANYELLELAKGILSKDGYEELIKILKR